MSYRCTPRTHLVVCTITAAVLIAAAGTRADVISSSSDMIQPGFVYAFGSYDSAGNGGGGGGGGGAGGSASVDFLPSPLSLTGLKLFSVTGQPTPPDSTPVAADLDGDGLFDVSVAGSPPSTFANFLHMHAQARRREGGGTRATMDIIIESMDFGSLPNGARLRESPTLASTGIITVESLPDGNFRINSFFDVFVELSLDGGQTWIPGSGPVQLSLLPAPSASALIGMGLLLTARRRR